MTDDDRLVEQLTRSLSRNLTDAPPNLLDSVMTETAATPQARRRAWAPGAAALVAAVAVVVLFIPVMLFGLSEQPGQSSMPVPSVRGSASPDERPSPEPSVSVPSVYDSWDRVDLPPAPPDGAPTGLVRFGQSLVAVGAGGSCCASSDVRGAVWVSADGERWELVPEQEPLAGVTLREVATDGETLLALGAVWPEAPTGPNIIGERAVFQSADARTWDRLDDAPPVSRLVGFSGRYVGLENRDDQLVAWLTDDGGETWTDRPIPGMLADGEDRFALNDLIAGADGELVAVGAVLPDPARLTPPSGTSWISTDGGETWNWAGEPIPGVELRHVARALDQFVALGTHSMSTWVYHSDDGLTWTGMEVVRHQSPDVQAASWLGGTGEALVLLTYELNPDGGLVATMRTSTDGTAWSIVPDQSALDGVNVAFAEISGASEGAVVVGTYAPEPGMSSRPAGWLSR